MRNGTKIVENKNIMQSDNYSKNIGCQAHVRVIQGRFTCAIQSLYVKLLNTSYLTHVAHPFYIIREYKIQKQVQD